MGLIQSSGEQAWTNAAGTSFSMPGNFTAGNTAILMVTFWYPSTYSAPSATMGGDSGTVDRAHNYSTNTEGLAIIRVSDLTGGSASVSVTAPAGSYGVCVCLEFDDIALSSPLDQNPTPTTGTTGDPSITSGTLSQADERVFSVVANDGQATPPAGWEAPSGWDLRINYPNWSSSHSGGSADDLVASTDPVTAAWNWTIAQNLNWACILCTYLVDSGEPPAYTPPITPITSATFSRF